MSTNYESLYIFKWHLSTKLQLIKILVVLELTNICIEMNLTVLVVFKKIKRYRKASQTLKALITRYRGSLFST